MIDPLSLTIPLADTRPALPVLPTRRLLVPSPDHPDDYVIELDYSAASEFTRCPRAFENKHVHSRQGAMGPAPGFGDLFHRCEDLRLRTGLTPAVVQRQHELVAEYFLYHPPAPSDHRTASRMIDVLRLYNERYANDGWSAAVFSDSDRQYIECPFKIPLCTIPVNGVLPYPSQQLCDLPANTTTLRVRSLHIIYTGKIDCILHNSNLLWVVDHKTSSRGGSQFLSAFDLSLQTRGYVWAGQRILQRPLAGLILNALIIRPLTKTGVGQEFSRHNYFYSPDFIAEFEQNMLAISSDLVSCLVRGFFPQHARSFISPCDLCEYRDNCKLPLDQRAADLASDLYHNTTWNPMHQ